MRTIHTLKELRAVLSGYRQQGKRIGLVPTMGNLHEGHISLVEQARQAADVVVTSIFVNPMQFGASEDLDNYPRTLQEDQDRLQAAGNSLIFAPSPEEVYPEGLAQQAQVIVPEMSEGHCGTSRPGHFEGVATVVTMLFNMTQPDVAVFGEKDFQQLAVIRKLTKDLFIPVEIIGAPTVRDADGVAKSSRNGYLTAEERAVAPTIFNAMEAIATALAQGATDYTKLENKARATLSDRGFRPDYVNIINSLTLKPAQAEDEYLTVLVAAFLGTTRLIDNRSVKR